MTETPQKPRWWLLAAIVLVALVAELIVWFSFSEDVTQQVLGTWVVVLVTFVLLLVWLLFLSRLPWKWRLIGLADIGLTLAILLALFRYDGLAGDFTPLFSFRFSPDAEERAAALYESDTQAASAVAASGERLEIQPGDWPDFRGPNRDGHAPGEVVRANWSDDPPQALWRRAVGPAWSSIIVVGDLLFTQEQRGEQEAVVAYQADDGTEVWSHTNTARHDTFLGGLGPRATPVLHDSRLYALGATGILDCLDPLTGELHWSRDIAEDAGTAQLEFGFAGTPLVVGDLVVVNPGKNAPEGDDGSEDGKEPVDDGTPPGAVIAYDRLTGETVWKTGQRKAGYTAPRLETLDGVPQILVFSAWGLGGHDPASGEELWYFEWINPYGTNSVQPIVTADGAVFITTEATGSTLLDVRQVDGGWTVESRWENSSFDLRFNGAVTDGARVYGLDGGILTAIDLATGERAWKRGRYKFGQILLLRDHLLVLSETGKVALVDLSAEGMEELASFEAVDGRSWNHPTVRDGILYVRSDREMAAYDLRAAG